MTRQLISHLAQLFLQPICLLEAQHALYDGESASSDGQTLHPVTLDLFFLLLRPPSEYPVHLLVHVEHEPPLLLLGQLYSHLLFHLYLLWIAPD